jgi:two-component system phosphate regulon sensor histidine kinase PhoR
MLAGLAIFGLLAVYIGFGARAQADLTAEGQIRFPILICLASLSVVVLWLFWYAWILCGGIGSLLSRLGVRSDNSIDSLSPSGLISKLNSAVDARLDCVSGNTGDFEDEVKGLQIQLRLSERNRRNTEAIIYSISDAVIVVDEFDKLLMANEAAGDIFGFDFRDSQHKAITELTGSEHREFTNFLKRGGQSKGRATRGEIEFIEDDRPKTYDCIVSCVYDDNDQVCGVVGVLHDITREKEISQMKNDFVSHVSHELKTPLASITAYSELLVDGEADDEETRKEFYTVIQSQAQRLSRLIEDILNTSRIESGLIKINKKPVSLTILIEEQMQMIKGFAEEKGIEIIGQKPIVFDQVIIDKDMMSQVIVNLLSNAVKYTPAGGSVKIETEVDEIAHIARVSVIDTGVGIPSDEVDHVFEKFYRVKANNKQAKGTGLGLNLVKQIVERIHSGQVFVRSEVGSGSTFGFELPLAGSAVAEAISK